MITGRLPFPDAIGPAALITAQLKKTPEAPSAANPRGEIPPAMDRLILKMLAKDKANRHQDACREGHLPLPLPSHGFEGCATLQPATPCRARDATPQAALHLDFGGELGGGDQPGLELGAFGAGKIPRDITRNEPGLLFE
jgi:hypothetical protein